MLLNVKNLKAQIDGKQILKGLSLQINAGEVHAIMGPNGSGKSSLSKIISGHAGYEVTEGEIEYEINFKMKNLFELEPHERAQEGIFLGFQYPVEVPGVTNMMLLFESYNAIMLRQGVEPMAQDEFNKVVQQKAEFLGIKEDYLYRGVNVGFSGGEKKRNEILQLLVLNPRLAFLDEIDSGLDIDALKVVSKGVNFFKNKNNAVVLVTHYQRLLDYIKPDFVHVLSDGQIKVSGGMELVHKLEKQGYDWL